MHRSLALLVLCLPLPAAAGAGPGLPPAVRAEDADEQARQRLAATTDEQLWSAWKKLSADQRFEIAEWFRLDVSYLDTFQLRLQRHVLQLLDEDPGLLPELSAAPHFDPDVHAPGQPIRRKPLDEDAQAAKSARKRYLEERLLRPAWVYDWARRAIVRAPNSDDPERIFANGMAGFAPDADLAEALLLTQLDRGEEQSALAAFGHAYTDRSGKVYPGVTLYDAWASGADMEMPDVDVLGLLFSITGGYKRYTAPVPGSRHKKLYRLVGDLFADVNHYRAIREAVARLYLQPNPALPRGYQANLDRFHALWDYHESEIEPMAEDLPNAKQWERYLEAWVKRCGRKKELLEKGVLRRQALQRDAWAVRWTLLRVMQRAQAL